MKRWQKVYLSSKDSASSSQNFLHRGSCFISVNTPTRKVGCWGIWSTSGDRGAVIARRCVHFVVAAVKVWLEIRLLALEVGRWERLLYGKLNLHDIPKPIIICCGWCCRINIIALTWFSRVLLFPTCPSFRCPKFPFISESLAILSYKYSLTVLQPPGDLSAVLIILFRVSKLQ